MYSGTFFDILNQTLKNREVSPQHLEIINKNNNIYFVSKKHFDKINFELLNIFGTIGVKFEIVNSYKNDTLAESQIIISIEEFKKVVDFFEN